MTNSKNAEKSAKPKAEPNIRVIVYSLGAIVFIALTFMVDWMFIVGAVVLSVMSQRELMRKPSFKKRVLG